MYKGPSITLLADLSSDTMEVRRQWNDIQIAERKNKLLGRNSIFSKTTLQNEGEIKAC